MADDDLRDRLKRKLDEAAAVRDTVPEYRQEALRKRFGWRKIPVKVRKAKSEKRMEIAEGQVQEAVAAGEITEAEKQFLLQWYDDELRKIQEGGKAAGRRLRAMREEKEELIGGLGFEIREDADEGQVAKVIKEIKAAGHEPDEFDIATIIEELELDPSLKGKDTYDKFRDAMKAAGVSFPLTQREIQMQKEETQEEQRRWLGSEEGMASSLLEYLRTGDLPEIEIMFQGIDLVRGYAQGEFIPDEIHGVEVDAGEVQRAANNFLAAFRGRIERYEAQQRIIEKQREIEAERMRVAAEERELERRLREEAGEEARKTADLVKATMGTAMRPLADKLVRLEDNIVTKDQLAEMMKDITATIRGSVKVRTKERETPEQKWMKQFISKLGGGAVGPLEMRRQTKLVKCWICDDEEFYPWTNQVQLTFREMAGWSSRQQRYYFHTCESCKREGRGWATWKLTPNLCHWVYYMVEIESSTTLSDIAMYGFPMDWLRNCMEVVHLEKYGEPYGGVVFTENVDEGDEEGDGGNGAIIPPGLPPVV